MTTTLQATAVTLGYPHHTVSTALSFSLPPGGFTVIIGPNGCGKTTLLRALGRMLAPKAGSVLLDGKDIHRYPARTVAQRIGILPQSPLVPEAITVTDLVARGRYPHQSLLQQWSPQDDAAVRQALTLTQTADLADRYVDELSGGQRQRVWIAMTLAQGTDVILLDEPTTFLDIAHQLDVLDLLAQLHRNGNTMGAVLHDLNMASRYATHIVAMREGAIVAVGPPAQVLTVELLREVYSIDAHVISDPDTGRPFVIPRKREAAL